jgi:hypothetical protein
MESPGGSLFPMDGVLKVTAALGCTDSCPTVGCNVIVGYSDFSVEIRFGGSPWPTPPAPGQAVAPTTSRDGRRRPRPMGGEPPVTPEAGG